MTRIRHSGMSGIVVAIAFFSLATAAPALGGPGDFDSSFGQAGVGRVGSFGYGQAVAATPDGGAAVVGPDAEGEVGPPSDRRIAAAFAVGKLTSSGAPDTRFDGDGAVRTDFSSNDAAWAAYPYDVIAQPDGKLVVIGYAYAIVGVNSSSQHRFAIARYNVDGSLDLTFGTAGKVLLKPQTGCDNGPNQALGGVLQPDGKIVFAGLSCGNTAENRLFTLVRLTSNGQLDSTFGQDGITLTDFGRYEYARAFRVALAPDGSIVASGTSQNTDPNRPPGTKYGGFAVARYTSEGRADSAFSGDGQTIVYNTVYDSQPWGLVIDPQGSVTVAGSGATGSRMVFSLMRLTSNGALDSTFDGDGLLTTAVGTDTPAGGAMGLVLEPSGKLVASGVAYNPDRGWALVRYLPDGRLDPSFGSNGTGIVAGEGLVGGGLTKDGAGRLLMGGCCRLVAARFLDDEASIAPPPPQPPPQGCNKAGRQVGVVTVCADSVSAGGIASGNVRVNGGVRLGDGPISLEERARRIVSQGVVPIDVRGAGQEVDVGRARVEIDASGASEGISGRDRLAKVELRDAEVAGVRLGGLKVPLLPAGEAGGLYLDGRDGGGLVAAVKLKISAFGQEYDTGDAASVGIHADRGIKLLSGALSFPAVGIGRFGFGGLKLSYQESSDTWRASGAVNVVGAGLEGDGSVAGGGLESLGLKVSGQVPVGGSGFILTSLGGRLDGVRSGGDSLKVSGSASLSWIKTIYLNDVTLTIDTAGAATFKGPVSFGPQAVSIGPIKVGSPVTGQIDLGARLDPLTASGAVSYRFDLLGTGLSSSSSIAMRTSAFTALGDAEGKIVGKTISRGRAVVSDRGAGASGEAWLCDWKFRCGNRTLSVGLRWGASKPQFGVNIDDLVTVRASETTRRVRVPRGQTMLMIVAEGAATPPAISMRSPSGRRYSTADRGAGSYATLDPARRLALLRIDRPRPGGWTLKSSGKVQVEAVPVTTRVRPRQIRPATSRGKRLPRKTRRLRLSWSSRGLPRGARAALYVSRRPGSVGRPLERKLPVRGHTFVFVRRLRRGANYLHLLVTRNGIPIDDVPFPKPVWR